MRLQGEWLNDAGFGIGSLFVADVTENKIVLRSKKNES
ncbi:MAG: hypothetical protein HYS25_13680 [Ignavibacteriales bacterium]|nr:hypothetical protein [Ignavibacteriales bacterium]